MTVLTADRYLEVTRAFADVVLEHGRDRYGDTETPLFVDALDPIARCGAKYTDSHWIEYDTIYSNLADQGNPLRMLDGLSALS